MNKLLIWSAGIATLSAFVGFTAAAIYPVSTPQPEYSQPLPSSPPENPQEVSDTQSLETPNNPSNPQLLSNSNVDRYPQEVSDTQSLETPNNPSNPQPLSNSSADRYPRQPILLEDEAKPGTDFFQFRQQLRQIVRLRDAESIRSIALPNINLTFGSPLTLDDLDIDNPDAPFWDNLERAISTGCAVSSTQVSQTSGESQVTWSCPHAFAADFATLDLDPYEIVFITAENVNVRAQPNLESPVVGVVSHEVVKYDSQTPLDETTREAGETLEGWKPIVLPNGQRGFVSSRYAYSPIGYRALFTQVDGVWRMQTFIAGD